MPPVTPPDVRLRLAYPPARPRAAVLPSLVALLVLAGCGGGGGGEGSSSDDGTNGPNAGPTNGDPTDAPSATDRPQPGDGPEPFDGLDTDVPTVGTGDVPDGDPDDGPVHGIVRLERRADKLTADAWFLPMTASTDAEAVRAEDSGDDCTLESVALDDEDAPVAPTGTVAGGTPSVGPTLDPATRLAATARTGEYLALVPQRLGSHVVYATESRWIRDPLPDDLSLVALAETGETLFDPVALRAVPDPVVLVPADGRLDTLSTPLRWSPPPAGAATRARLVLSAWRGHGEGERDGRLATIRCRLEDDGEFLVPAPLRAEAGEASGGWTARFVRERRTTVERDGSRLEIVQAVLP